MLRHYEQANTILPDGIKLLDEVFTEILTDKGLPRDCEAAARIATALFSIYLSGVRERDRLRQMVEVG
ncbi:hypothetical protein [Sinorhizobium meliloti]|uniref:Uncharacterized protein n=1 Tax=Sinorhizobium meliloti (strain SM11) TaxID=707241 RepID=F7XBX3_SINMM|nr:hypothetical protein [Sinorhizobium meliloti]AEH82560.1 hypothetical protein SM11_pC1487 [Sinorhizobium meliloti SM11]ARS67568.1 hypothetical protein SMRU11_10585 [Sinorhizobium meliloti RU11/001]ASP66565.1 hypothetical protein CDO29_18245 [Sinorhizobium meliloti]ASP80166.1 hypothetical protein CDO27_19320 [Sinorhizobium meliloti]ASQ01164.1 hypothetical protein CDO24_27405 [Sinorhizobium meliloti]